MDINGFSWDPLNMADSNPGRVEYCPGGVGRNIAENLHRLGAEVRLISVIGDDPGGEFIKTSSARIGLNIEHSLFLKSGEQVTSVYIALMDSDGEMKLALADMNIMEHITEKHLESKAGIIKESAIVLLDTNLPERIINFILDTFGGGPLFFLDGVSARKAPRAAPRIGSFDTLKIGRMEASVLTGIEIPELGEPGRPMSAKQWEKFDKMANFFISKGTRRVFITLGKEGIFTASAGRNFFSPVQYVRPLNTSGGGDAVMAGIAYGTLQGWDDEKIVSFSLAMGRITVQCGSTVSPYMNLKLVEKNML